MTNAELRAMSVDQLWKLHEELVVELSRKIAVEKAKLEERLRKIGSSPTIAKDDAKRERRPYPKVYPKYRNPKNRGETWAGRGKQPRWLATQLRAGKSLDDFLIRRG
jgi:DNA-binding protein H-NS